MWFVHIGNVAFEGLHNSEVKITCCRWLLTASLGAILKEGIKATGALVVVMLNPGAHNDEL